MFSETRFDSPLDFTNAKIKGDPIFEKTTLPEILILIDVETNYEVNLLETIFISNKERNGEKCKIDLIGASIEKLELVYDHFAIYKPDTIPSKLHYQRLISVYEKLYKNFKDKEYLNSYELLEKEYQEFKYTQNLNHSKNGIPSVRVVNWIQSSRFDYGYGIGIGKFLIYVLILMVFFSVINYFAFMRLIEIYPFENVISAYIKTLEKNRQKVRVRLSPFYTLIVFPGLKISIEKINLNNSNGVIIYIFFQYLAGLICLAYLAKFGFQAITI